MRQLFTARETLNSPEDGYRVSARFEGMLLTKAQAFSPTSSSVAAIIDDISWGGSSGSPATVAYSFSKISTHGGTLFGSEAQTAALQVMQHFSDVANITFNNTSSVTADLAFSQAGMASGTLGLTYTSYSGASIASAEVQLTSNYTSNFGAGNDAYLTLLHELGHAVGFKHPGNYSGSETAPFLSSAEDTNDASVMSYNSGTYATFSTPPQTLMIYDIAALQFLYGANSSYHSGDNGYSFDGSGMIQTIWDGGGSGDMISAQSYTAGANTTIDLREGLSNITHIGNDHVWIAVGANIERAEGSNGADTIYGNSLANTLFGMSGADISYGGEGADTIYGGTGIVSPVDGDDQIFGEGGSDYLYGNGGNDTIYGGTGIADPNDAADTIYGGGGSDAVYGNGGDDSLSGGGSAVDPNDASDTVYGGGGADTIYGNGGNDFLFGGGSTVDPNDAADLIYAGVGDDSILGNGGNDTIYGNEGNDTMQAGVGDDVYAFGNDSGVDLIQLFDNPGAGAGDVIQLLANLNGSGIHSATDALAHVTYANNQAIIDLSGGNTITIDGIASGALTVEDFLILA